MKKVRLSPAGKGVLSAISLAVFGLGAGFGIVSAVTTETPVTESAASAPGGIHTLVNEFSAAVSAEAKAKMEQAAANAGKPEIVRQTCADVGAMLAKLSADSGITTPITVSPYQAPSSYFEFGYCVIEAGGNTITFIKDGEELTSKSDRQYLISELISKLPGEDILKIHATLSKAPRP